jgi:hypothetical protein
MMGLTQITMAQDARTLLVVNLQGKASYTADDMNHLQSVITPFRKQYGIAVQGFDKDMGGYVIFSSQTKLTDLAKSEMESLKSTIVEAYPGAVISLKQQRTTLHTSQQGKLPSAQPKK